MFSKDFPYKSTTYNSLEENDGSLFLLGVADILTHHFMVGPALFGSIWVLWPLMEVKLKLNARKDKSIDPTK